MRLYKKSREEIYNRISSRDMLVSYFESKNINFFYYYQITTFPFES